MMIKTARRFNLGLACMACIGHSFVIPTSSSLLKTTSLSALFKEFQDVGYTTRVSKPLGVIFGENPDPFYGLVVDDVEPGLNGGVAGLRLGDNLVAVNGESVVGEDFDTAMANLVDAEGEIELQLYRGPVSSLYTILSNINGAPDDQFASDEELVIMDENYESPVRIEVEEEEPLTPADVFNAMKKIGSKLMESDEKPPPKEKKKGGMFGGLFSGETVQLEGDEASGLK